MLTTDHCYRALLSRDSRFDGKFFVGVSSTGIYCRPVCTARTPMRTRCTFYPSAAAAEGAGFRPCLRCRPELAPGNACVDAPQRIAHAAASLIDDGFLEENDLALLAARLGVTDRHLRRVFQAEFGVAPVGYAQTQRLLLAKRLLTDTTLPVTDIALAAGFGSVRRFNALFQARYRMQPTRLRHDGGAGTGTPAMRFELAYRPPLPWDTLLAFLGHRAIQGVEAVAGHEYRRTVAVAHGGHVHRGWIAVRPAARRATLQVSLSPGLARVVPPVLARVKRLFDLACDPHAVAAQLGELAAAHPGLRVPGAFDGFEMAVRAILGQQVTVKAATTLSGRIARAFGDALATPWAELTHTFPAAGRVAALTVDDVASNGIIASRSRSILALAGRIADGTLVLAPGVDVERTLAALRAVPGIGEWTAQYIAMRALAWPDAFPHTDLGVMKALGETSPRRVLARAEPWQPWRAYAVMHLWHSTTPKETT
ncbi:MAG: DNA-3-methyladenine glycosylase 2 [Betaproteobacteria bacterium]|nr:DNA-3-methyladenine glycosylase 2 [Betaproteobacteria bacterium]